MLFFPNSKTAAPVVRTLSPGGVSVASNPASNSLSTSMPRMLHQRKHTSAKAATAKCAQQTRTTDASTGAQTTTQDGYVWYFAYGSNMNSSVLEGRRKVTPAESCAARLPGYTLAFDVRGFPYREPAFASVVAAETCSIEEYWKLHANGNAVQANGAQVVDANEKSDLTKGQLWNSDVNDLLADTDSMATHTADQQQILAGRQASATLHRAPVPEAHGVVHRITDADWASVCATEWATKDGKGSYVITPVKVYTYDGRTVDAFTLTAGATKLHERYRAVPSQRYMGLLVEGAEQNAIDDGYQKYLRFLPVYAPPPGPRFAAGRLIYFLLSRILFAPIILTGLLLRLKVKFTGAPQGPAQGPSEGAKTGEPAVESNGKGKRESSDEKRQAAATATIGMLFRMPLIARYLRGASAVSWGFHDLLLKPLFGCGISTAAPAVYDGTPPSNASPF